MAHILVVDDERDVVTLITLMLEKEGHRVTPAYDGAEALARMGLEPEAKGAAVPDLVILDVMMPVLDGTAVSARMAEHPRTQKVPLIVLSAKGEVRDLFHAAPNVAAYVDKPFDPRKLKELVSGILSPKARPS